MRTFGTRQEMLKWQFNCICKVCKNGPAEDKADFVEYEKLMQDNENLKSTKSLDYQTNCMRLVEIHQKAYNLGKKNKASPSLLYDRLLQGFEYASFGFRVYKKEEFKRNALKFAVAGKKMQELFGFVVPEKGEWQKRIDFDKWIQEEPKNLSYGSVASDHWLANFHALNPRSPDDLRTKWLDLNERGD